MAENQQQSLAPQQNTSAPAHKPETNQIVCSNDATKLTDYISVRREEFLKKVPKEASNFDFDLMLSQVAYKLRMDKNLKKSQCTLDSWCTTIMNMCLTGLMPGYASEKTGEIYLIPYGPMMTASPSYRGMQITVMRTGLYRDFDSFTVWEGDFFERSKSPIEGDSFAYTDKLKHELIQGHMAFCVSLDNRVTDVYYTKRETEEHESNSRQGDYMKDTWKKWPRQMGEKVVIKVLCKKLSAKSPHKLIDTLLKVDSDNEKLFIQASTPAALAEGLK